MALPFLPGNSFDTNLGKSRFHKSQAFEYRGNVPVVLEKPGIGGVPLAGQPLLKNNSVYPKGLGGNKPAWVAFDKQVLRFYAYFQEAVHEKRDEQYRIRKCVVLFYLEDDTIQVNEPKMDNSGIPQGTLIRRHRVPLPAPNDKFFYTIENFNVGEQIVLHGRVFQLTDCDDFTHNFLTKMGVVVPPPLETPKDPYTSTREELQATMQPLRPYERMDTLRQFLDHDREVLRIYCFWDDTDSMFGDPREMELHYFLADDTIEIVEKIHPNSGRDAVSMFLRRAPLPKMTLPVNQPGVQSKRTVLNVFGPMGHGGRYVLDSLKTGALNSEFYHDSDLMIGSTINVWGRKLLLCGCDNFTKEYYRTKYGIENMNPIDIREPEVPAPKREPPPYNGFGSEEDSLASCMSLIPKPPRKDFLKFAANDRQGLESNVLRLVARLESNRPVDHDRRFIVIYYLSDDTLSIFEPVQKNSGILAGKFLEQTQVAKPKDSELEPTVHYQAEDLYIGSRVQIYKHNFVLIDADEYALRYMEKHKEQFPQSNISLILSKLKGPAAAHFGKINEAFAAVDAEDKKVLAYEQFSKVVKSLSKSLLNEHEMVTLARHYGEKQYPILTSLVCLIQDVLSKERYTKFSELEAALQEADRGDGGFITRDLVRFISKKVNLPLSDQLIDGALMNCQTNVKDEVDYRQFVQLLNWRDHPLQREKIKIAAGSVCDPLSKVAEWSKTLGPIHYPDLISDLHSMYS